MSTVNIRVLWAASLLFGCVFLFSNCRNDRGLGLEEGEPLPSPVSSSSALSGPDVQRPSTVRLSSQSSVLQATAGTPSTALSIPQRSTPLHYSQTPVALRQKIYMEIILRKELRDLAFGKQVWAQHFGDVGEEPPLPCRIINILDSPCPFWEGQKVRDTHLLVLIPATVDGEQFTLNKLGELIKKQFPSNEDGYGSYNPSTRNAFGNTSLPEAPYWLLMTRDVLEGSRQMSYPDQQAMVNRYSNNGYRLPFGLEAATTILTHYVRSGARRERLFGDDPWTYTRCTAIQLPEERSPLVVGGFEAEGLAITHCDTEYYDGDGVSCCRRL